MGKWLALSFHVLAAVGAASIMGLMLLTVVEVAMRYLANKPLTGVYEVSEFIFVGSVMLALAHTERIGGHIKVDVLTERLPPRAQLALATLMLLIALAICSILVWQGVEEVVKSRQLGEVRYGETLWPMWPAKLTVPVGFASLSLALMVSMSANLRRLFSPKTR